MTRAEQLAEAWLFSDLSDAETREFLALWEQDDGPLPDLIAQWLSDPSFSGWADLSREDALFQKILEKTRMGERAQRTRLIQIPRRVVAAAAAVLLLLGGSWWWLHRNLAKNTPPIAAQTAPDIAPGGNHATLTLASGQKILLDSAANGTLAQQGSTQIIKLDSGQLSYHVSLPTNSKSEIYNTLSTPRGGQYQLTLPDGSRVWLNAASSITYPTAFTGKDRKVTITGEAYFEVARNPDHPFRVASSAMTIDVLGTSFNINGYPDEPDHRTTLLEGSVKITRAAAANEPPLILRPGQQARATSTGIDLVKDPDIAQTLAWKNGLFDFNHADLATVLRQLARWYDINVRYEGRPPARTFHGKITRDLNLSQVIKVLQDIEVKFRIEGKTLIVTG